MPLFPTLNDLILRLVLACAAGALVGFNREGRNQAAGLRTTLLVCLAACLAMVLSNLLLATTGKESGDFGQMDPLRLPLGILSGIGFLGAGAIIKRGDTAHGVTTAATLWFMTVVGLCFGAGELILGTAGTLIALAVIWGLKWADEQMHHKQHASLVCRAEREKLPEAELRRTISGTKFRIVSWTITYGEGGASYEAVADLEWDGRTQDRTFAPPLVEELACRAGVSKAEWRPEKVSS